MGVELIKLDFIKKNKELNDFREKYQHKKWFNGVQRAIYSYYIEKKLFKAWKKTQLIDEFELSQSVLNIDKLLLCLLTDSILDKEALKSFIREIENFHLLFLTQVNPRLSKLNANHYFLIKASDIEEIIQLIKPYKIECRFTAHQTLLYSTGEIQKNHHNMNLYPQFCRDLDIPINAVTIGDLHGNALKLLHFLITESIIEFDEDRFIEFKDCYYKLLIDFNDLKFEFKQDCIHKINSNFNTALQLILLIKIKDPKTLVRLIGDELADRGAHDWLTLKLLQQLPNLEIIFSNHTLEFLKSYYPSQQQNFLNAGEFEKNNQANSLVNLRQSYKMQFIELNQLQKAIDQHHILKIKLLSYAFKQQQPNELFIFTHAPTSIDGIKAISDYFLIPFKDETAQELASTIDKINEFFKTYILGKKQFGLCNHQSIFELIWNRNHQLARPQTHKTYRVHYVHGHDCSKKLNESHITNLDGRQGKTIFVAHQEIQVQNLAEYKVLRSFEKPMNAPNHKNNFFKPAQTSSDKLELDSSVYFTN